MTDASQPVRRRRVFYVPGYDPFHPRRYRELYRREGAAQAALSGFDLALSPRKGGGAYGWHVDASIDGIRTETDFEVLVWSDIVRDSMDQGLLATYLQLMRAAWVYFASGAVFRLARLRKGPILAGFYPVVMLLAQLGLASAAGWGLAQGIGLFLPQWLGWLAGLVLVPLVLNAFRRIDGKLFAYYLMHDLAFSVKDRGAYPAELEARMTAFRQSLRAALAPDVDEVLVVGHSSGVQVAVSVLADLLREGLPDRAPALSFLSLGQSVPMLSFLPDAGRLRADLHYLADHPGLTWVDVSAPGDGCAFALCDPVAVSGVAPVGKRWPLVLSAAFSQTLRPKTWARLKRRYFRLHFQYLCAFDNLPGRADDYDYFRITAGPQTLAARLGGRRPSQSRIETARSGHVSMAA